MSRTIALIALLATLTAISSTLAFKLTHRPALAAQPAVDPAILHAHRQRWQDDMPLP
jgi:hypothetical protein